MTDEVAILFYGPPAPAGCGYFYFGQAVRVRKADGNLMDLAFACTMNGTFNGKPLPAEGTTCRMNYRTLPPGRILVELIADRTDKDSAIEVIETLDCR